MQGSADGQLQCYDRTSFICRYIGLHHLFSHLPHTEAHVRYDLEACSCTIRSDNSFHYTLYDINLGDTHTTILSIRGAQIPIYLVRGATDSFSDA